MENVCNNIGSEEKLASPSWWFSVRNLWGQTKENKNYWSKETKRFSGKLVGRIPSKTSLRPMGKGRIRRQWVTGSKKDRDLNVYRTWHNKSKKRKIFIILPTWMWFGSTRHTFSLFEFYLQSLNTKSCPNVGGTFSRLTALQDGHLVLESHLPSFLLFSFVSLMHMLKKLPKYPGT